MRVVGSRMARSSARRGLPAAVRGIASSRMKATGTLNRASRSRHSAMSASSPGSACAVPQHDRGHRHLAVRRIGPGDHHGVGDGRVVEEDGFDLRWARCSRRRGRSDRSGDPRRSACHRRRAGRGRRSRSQPSSDQAAAVASGSPRYSLNSAGPVTWISPMPSASGPAMRSATPGSGRPAVSGWIAASSVGDAVTPEPASDRPYVGTTGQPAAMARRDEGRRDRATTEGHGPERRRRSDVPTEVEQAGQGGRHERDVARMGSGAQRRQDRRRGPGAPARPTARPTGRRARRRPTRRHAPGRPPGASRSPREAPPATPRRWPPAPPSTGRPPSAGRSSPR